MLTVKTILHPTDFSRFSAAGFQLACALARDYGARLVLVHVAPPVEIMHGSFYASPPTPPDDLEAVKEELFALKPADPTVDVEYFFRRGDVAGEILSLAKEVAADIIVLGTHGRTGLSRLLMGSVAERVLREAECPVVTVKRPVGAEAVAGGETHTAAVATA